MNQERFSFWSKRLRILRGCFPELDKPSGMRYGCGMSKDCWQFSEAKARLAQVLKKAHDRPQRIRRNGKEEFVIMTWEDYEALIPGGAQGLFEPVPPEEAAKDFWNGKK
jgi:prevent-host-death family protein